MDVNELLMDIDGFEWDLNGIWLDIIYPMGFLDYMANLMIFYEIWMYINGIAMRWDKSEKSNRESLGIKWRLSQSKGVGKVVRYRWFMLDKDWLVVSNIWIMTFHILGMENHPNWRTQIFQRGRYTTNQKMIRLRSVLLSNSGTNQL